MGITNFPEISAWFVAATQAAFLPPGIDSLGVKYDTPSAGVLSMSRMALAILVVMLWYRQICCLYRMLI